MQNLSIKLPIFELLDHLLVNQLKILVRVKESTGDINHG